VRRRDSMPLDPPPMTDGPATQAPPAEAAPAAASVAREPRPGRYPSGALALIGAVLGCLAIVAFLVLIVVRPDNVPPARTDWHAVAETAAADLGSQLLDPALPDGWTANFAEVRQVADVPTWAIGFLSPTQGYVELEQGFASLGDAAGSTVGDAWLTAQIGDGEVTDSIVIEGLSWSIIDRRAEKDPGNDAFTMYTNLGDTVVALHGTGSDDDFRVVADAVAADPRAG